MLPARSLIGEGARLHGERLAVVSDRGRATYADLDLRSDRLARALATRGVAVGDRVVVFMDDSIEAIVAIGAILKAGGVVAPVDARTDVAELAFVLDDCRPTAIITEARLGAATAEAMKFAASVRLVVLAGGDQGSISDTCLAFEDAVGRGASVDAPLPAGTVKAVLLVYPRTPAGLAAPVTMTDADVAVPTGPASSAVGAVVEGIRPMAGARGIAMVFAAFAAGATMVLAPGGSFGPRRAARAA